MSGPLTDFNHKSNHRGKPHASDDPSVSISISNQEEDTVFDRFWAVFPKQVNKAAAKREWPVALQKASAVALVHVSGVGASRPPAHPSVHLGFLRQRHLALMQ